MTEIIVVLLLMSGAFASGYNLGFGAGEKSMFRRFTSPNAAERDAHKEE